MSGGTSSSDSGRRARLRCSCLPCPVEHGTLAGAFEDDGRTIAKMPPLTEESARDALLEVIDPEVGINIVDLGLIYRIEVVDGRIEVDMTMTTAACPLGPHLRETAQAVLHRSLPEAESVAVHLVWDPPWTPERMSGRARRQLGWQGGD